MHHRRAKALVFTGALLALAGCPLNDPPSKLSPGQVDPDACPAACANLERLHCPEATVPPPHTCVEVCDRYESSHTVAFYAPCIASATVRTDLAHCNVRCLQP